MMICHTTKLRPLAVALACAALSSAVAAQNTAMVMKEFGTWSLHQSRDSAHNICYAVATPFSKKPKKANRAAVVFYVSAWPKDGVRNPDQRQIWLSDQR